MYMDPGHLCLRVNLDQPYYVDVGYCAPLFQAYPLYESFQVSNVRETFTYEVSNNRIKIARNPGPAKSYIQINTFIKYERTHYKV